MVWTRDKNLDRLCKIFFSFLGRININHVFPNNFVRVTYFINEEWLKGSRYPQLLCSRVPKKICTLSVLLILQKKDY